MNIDKKIKHELQQEAQHLDAILAQEPGVFGMLNNSYHGAMRVWLIIASVAGFIATIVLLWCGYQFFIATQLSEQVFWGVWLIVSLLVQAMLKLWVFMEMNRSSTVREIKRVELAVEQLQSAIEDSAK